MRIIDYPDRIELDELIVSVDNYTRQFAQVWNESNSTVPTLGRVYSLKEKSAREKDIMKFFDALKKETSKNGFNEKESLKNYDKYVSVIKTFLKDGINFEKYEIDILFEHGFLKVTSEFFQAARDYDPKLTIEEIFQACRNVWAMNWLQLLFEKPVELTPSIFAYSMLYPYTDNYLDNPGISRNSKVKFNERLSMRLQGEMIEPENSNERAIYDFISMIEGQYERSEYPGVFQSLIAIHSAQIKSLRLLKSDKLSDEELLNISLEKGGTSVLADGYLVAGELTEVQKIFLFGYGAYLQLVDDLQDVCEDSNSGQLTIYSKAAKENALDNLINQTYNFGERILTNSGLFNINEPDVFELMKKSSRLLLIVAVGITSEYYSSPYVSDIERHSPFRFSFLKNNQKFFFDYGVMLVNISKK